MNIDIKYRAGDKVRLKDNIYTGDYAATGTIGLVTEVIITIGVNDSHSTVYQVYTRANSYRGANDYQEHELEPYDTPAKPKSNFTA